MYMGIETTSCNDFPFPSNNVSTGSDDHVWRDAFHHVWISGLANADDETILDTNVCFVDAGPVND